MNTVNNGRRLPEGWRETGFKDHLFYKECLVVVRGGDGRTKMIASKNQRTFHIEDQSLERAMAKMERELENIL